MSWSVPGHWRSLRWSARVSSLTAALFGGPVLARAPARDVPAQNVPAQNVPAQNVPAQNGSANRVGARSPSANSASANSAVTNRVLEWDAPRGCPSGDALEQSLVDSLGEPLDFGRLRHIRGKIEKQTSGWVLRLDLAESDRRRTRLIRAERCEDLADAAALAIRLAVTSADDAAALPSAAANDRETTATALLSPERDTAAPSANAVDAASEPAEPLSVPTGERRVGVALTASAALDLNSLSRLSPGLSVEGRVLWERFGLGLYALWLAPATVAVSAGESVGFDLMAGGPRACYQILEEVVRAELCAAFELGRFEANGHGLSRNEHRFSQWWAAPSVGIELAAPFGRRWAAQARMEALRPLVRRDYGVNATERVYAPSLLGARLYLGLSFNAE